MSPEEKHEFEAVWPELASRLHAFLARKRVPLDQREDLVQETGARLVGIWDTVDRGRPTWPLAMTVALNLVRDRARRQSGHEVVSEFPDIPQAYDLEAAGIARMELEEVRSAMTQLSARQREVLLAEIGVGDESLTRDKMTRSRARRKLNLIVGRLAAGISIQYRRVAEMFHAVVGSEGALQGLGCSACALLAMGAVLVPHATSAFPRELSTSDAPVRELIVVSDATQNGALALRAGALGSLGSSTDVARSDKARKASAKKVPTAEPASVGTTVPTAGDLPDLPGRGGPDDEVPVPRPPGAVKELVDRVARTVKADLPL